MVHAHWKELAYVQRASPEHLATYSVSNAVITVMYKLTYRTNSQTLTIKIIGPSSLTDHCVCLYIRGKGKFNEKAKQMRPCNNNASSVFHAFMIQSPNSRGLYRSVPGYKSKGSDDLRFRS